MGRLGDTPLKRTIRRHQLREIVPLAIDTIASGGGGIHCATHDLPGEPDES